MAVLTKDEVKIIAGKDKGKTGVVKRVIKKQDNNSKKKVIVKVVVTGVNFVTKHIKGKEGQSGQKIQVEAPMHISNVMLIDPKTKERTRVGYTISESGEKHRVAKKSGEILHNKAKKK